MYPIVPAHPPYSHYPPSQPLSTQPSSSSVPSSLTHTSAIESAVGLSALSAPPSSSSSSAAAAPAMSLSSSSPIGMFGPFNASTNLQILKNTLINVFSDPHKEIDDSEIENLMDVFKNIFRPCDTVQRMRLLQEPLELQAINIEKYYLAIKNLSEKKTTTQDQGTSWAYLTFLVLLRMVLSSNRLLDPPLPLSIKSLNIVHFSNDVNFFIDHPQSVQPLPFPAAPSPAPSLAPLSAPPSSSSSSAAAAPARSLSKMRMFFDKASASTNLQILKNSLINIFSDPHKEIEDSEIENLMDMFKNIFRPCDETQRMRLLHEPITMKDIHIEKYYLAIKNLSKKTDTRRAWAYRCFLVLLRMGLSSKGILNPPIPESIISLNIVYFLNDISVFIDQPQSVQPLPFPAAPSVASASLPSLASLSSPPSASSSAVVAASSSPHLVINGFNSQLNKYRPMSGAIYQQDHSEYRRFRDYLKTVSDEVYGNAYLSYGHVRYTAHPLNLNPFDMGEIRGVSFSRENAADNLRMIRTSILNMLSEYSVNDVDLMIASVISARILQPLAPTEQLRLLGTSFIADKIKFESAIPLVISKAKGSHQTNFQTCFFMLFKFLLDRSPRFSSDYLAWKAMSLETLIQRFSNIVNQNPGYLGEASLSSAAETRPSVFTPDADPSSLVRAPTTAAPFGSLPPSSMAVATTSASSSALAATAPVVRQSWTDVIPEDKDRSDAEIYQLLSEKERGHFNSYFKEELQNNIYFWKKGAARSRLFLTKLNGRKLHKSYLDYSTQQLIDEMGNLSINLKSKVKESRYYRLHTKLVLFNSKKSGIEADPKDPRYGEFSKRLGMVFPDEHSRNVITTLFNENAAISETTTPLDSLSLPEEVLKGIGDIRYLVALKEREAVLNNIEMFFQDSDERKKIDGCFLYYKDEAIEIYPLQLEFRNSSLLSIGTDPDGSIRRRMATEIPCLRSQATPLVTTPQGFSISYAESQEITDFYQANKKTFYLLSMPPESAFADLVAAPPVAEARTTTGHRHEGGGGLGSLDDRVASLNPNQKKRKPSPGNDDPRTDDGDSSDDEPKVKRNRVSKKVVDTDDGPLPVDEEEDEVEDSGFVVAATPPVVSSATGSFSIPASGLAKTLSPPVPCEDPFELIFQEFGQAATKKLQKCKRRALEQQLDDQSLVDVSKPLMSTLSTVVPIAPDTLTFEDSLKSYQKEAVAWMLGMTRAGLGAILSSAPGLGKTRQAIEFMRQLQKNEPTGKPMLVIAPNSIVEQWRDTLLNILFEHRVQHIAFLLAHGGTLSPAQIGDLYAGLNRFADSQEQELEKLAHERTKVLRMRDSPPAGSISSSSASPRIVSQKELALAAIDEKEALLKQRKRTIDGLLLRALNEIPGMSEKIFSPSEITPALIKEQLKWIAALLSDETYQTKIKTGMKGALTHPRLIYFKGSFETELAKSSVNVESILNCVKADSYLKTPVGFKSFTTFLKSQFSPSPKRAAERGPEIKLDPSLLHVCMYQQVCAYTSETQNEFAKVIDERAPQTPWRIIVASESAIQENGESSSKVKKAILERLKAFSWQAVIWDEVHTYSWKMTTKTDKIGSLFAQEFLRNLQKRGTHRILLTGTPFQNEYSETLSLIQLANPQFDLTGVVNAVSIRENSFSKQVNAFIADQNKNPEEDRVSRHSKELVTCFNQFMLAQEHLRFIFQQMIRIHEYDDPAIREAWTVGGVVHLPNKIMHHQVCGLKEPQEKAIGALPQNKLETLENRAQLLKIIFHPAFAKDLDRDVKAVEKSIADCTLDQINAFIDGSGLLSALFDQDSLLTKAIKENKSVLIIVPVINPGMALQEILKKKFPEVRTNFFYGKKTLEERDRIVKEFETITAVSKIVILSVDAGGVGLNLKNADLILDLAPWWNEAISEQAIARGVRANDFREKHIVMFDSQTPLEKRTQEIVNIKRLQRKFFFEGWYRPREITDRVAGLLHAYQAKIPAVENLDRVFASIKKIVPVSEGLVKRIAAVTTRCLTARFSSSSGSLSSSSSLSSSAATPIRFVSLAAPPAPPTAPIAPALVARREPLEGKEEKTPAKPISSIPGAALVCPVFVRQTMPSRPVLPSRPTPMPVGTASVSSSASLSSLVSPLKEYPNPDNPSENLVIIPLKSVTKVEAININEQLLESGKVLTDCLGYFKKVSKEQWVSSWIRPETFAEHARFQIMKNIPRQNKYNIQVFEVAGDKLTPNSRESSEKERGVRSCRLLKSGDHYHLLIKCS